MEEDKLEFSIIQGQKLLDNYKDELHLKHHTKELMHSPSQLAFLGDAVYEFLVRGYVINNYNTNVNRMHKEAVKFVKASSQMKIIKQLENELSEEENKVVKRGRNAKVTSSPKNADLMDYRYATGFEALFGYLYLNNKMDRITTLFNKCVQIINEMRD